MPSMTLPNGAVNPFYPCGATQDSINACPYRCYTASSGFPTLIDECFEAPQAAAEVAASSAICVACTLPQPTEIPTSPSDNNTCQPVSTYFSATDKSSPEPARCGTPQQPVSACTWSCAEEQVPFSLCSATNQTSSTEQCQKCVEQCSSPRIVFLPPTIPDFSLSTGACGTTDDEKRACPFRCTDAGDSNNAYCSLVDRTVQEGFTTCTAC